jgi:carboxyl-terminal processing protease
MSLTEAVKKLRGPRGTKVTISILREGWAEVKDFALVRDVIPIHSFKHKTLEESYGYVRIINFQDKTSQDLKSALDDLEQQNKPLKGLILDLRNNPGGLLDQAVKVADEFIEEGIIVYTDGRIKSQNVRFTAHGGEKPHPYPIIILVNEGSASASEIVAGALQDHKKAIILGAQTFGKGSVQTVIPLDDGSGLRLTTARYYTPGGRSIQAKGITPDIIVASQFNLHGEEMKKIKILREKDLEHHIKNDREEAGPETQPDIGEEVEKPDTDKDQKDEKAARATLEEDIQLNRALQILKSWEIFSKVKVN